MRAPAPPRCAVSRSRRAPSEPASPPFGSQGMPVADSSGKSVPWTCRDSSWVTRVRCPQLSPVIILPMPMPDSIPYPWVSPRQAQGRSLAERQSLMPREGL